MGCGNRGFFSIFSNPPRQCGSLNRRIEQQRDVLDRMQNQLEQLQGGTTRARLAAPVAADRARRQRLRPAIPRGRARRPAGRLLRPAVRRRHHFLAATVRADGQYLPHVCVRTCDGYYFPISFETTPDHFREDEQTCQRMCPAADVQLYTYHNPGEQMSQAVSLNGRLYTELPTAFQYRKALVPNCSCRRPGESWYEALVKVTAPTPRWRRATWSSPSRTPGRYEQPGATQMPSPQGRRQEECHDRAAAQGHGRSAGPGRQDQAQGARGRPDIPAVALGQ